VLVEKYSLTYWLHLSRRIGVWSGGKNHEPATIINNRFNVIALIQKYGKKEYCGHVGTSKQVSIEKIFNGLLLSPDFEIEKEIILSSPDQIVFTDFNSNNLYEYYILEKIGYELWKCGATLRSIGKNAVIIVDQSFRQRFFELDDETLDSTISSYDKRIGSFNTTETGTVFKTKKNAITSEIFIPVLNYSSITYKDLSLFIESVSHYKIESDAYPNFLMAPFPIKKYISAHLPFSEEFYRIHRVDYKTIVFCLGALCVNYFIKSSVEKKPNILHIMKRGYEGPEKKENIIDEIFFQKDYFSQIMGIENKISKDEIRSAIEFLELKDQKSIDIFNLGTLKFLIPAIDQSYFLDYSVIISILNNLFDKIDLNKYNFRGTLLEKAIEKPSYLPTKPLKNALGKEIQVDFAILIKKILIVAECKVVSKSNSFYKGSYNSIKYRTEKVVIRGLKEAGEKVTWLAKYPIGLNYNIQAAEFLLPVAVSSFVEYIHSMESYFWINDDIPRFLSIEEFLDFIDRFEEISIKNNLIKTESDKNDK
jgi:hypothetical protein